MPGNYDVKDIRNLNSQFPFIIRFYYFCATWHIGRILAGLLHKQVGTGIAQVGVTKLSTLYPSGDS